MPLPPKSTVRALDLPPRGDEATQAAPWTLRAGDVLAGKYTLVRPLGAGSMGQVWVARNAATNAEVAVKMLLPERSGTEDAFERFRREAHATSRLAHRGIVRAFDLVEPDTAAGTLLLVMELLRGQTLAQRLEQAGRLSIAETIQIVLPILSALDHAHASGVVHRDLKPDNIFLSVEPDGEVLPKLVDFGISKMRHAGALTKRGALVGTPCYMAPEQARGEDVDRRSDIFAAGIVLYECLSGRAPFGGETLRETVRAVLETEAAPLDDLPVELWEAIARAMAKSPDDRYATASDLAAAVVAAVPGLHATLRSYAPAPASLTSVPPAVSRTTTTLVAEEPRLRGALVVGAVCFVSVLAVWLATSRRPLDPTRAMPEEAASQAPSVARDVVTSAKTLGPAPLPAPLPGAPPPAIADPATSAKASPAARTGAPATPSKRALRASADAGVAPDPPLPAASSAPQSPPAPPAFARDPGF